MSESTNQPDQGASPKSERPQPKQRKTPKKVDVSKALELRLENNLTYQQIAGIQGTTKQAIHGAIKNLLPPKEIEQFKNKRADILAYTQYKDIEAYINLEPEERKKMIMRRGLVDMGISYDKERLERGQSTQIVDYRSFIIELKDAADHAKERLKQLDLEDAGCVDVEETKPDVD